MSRISDRPIPTNEPTLATKQTSETESVQKTDLPGKAIVDAEQSVRQQIPSTDARGAQYEMLLGGLARRAEMQSQFPIPSSPVLKDLPDLHPNLDPNVHLDEKIDVTRNLPDGHAINKGLDGLDWGPSKAKTGPGHFGVEMTYGGMKAPTDVLTDVLKPGKPDSKANVPRFKTGGKVDSAGSGGGSNSSISKEGSGTSSAPGPTEIGGNSIIGGRDMSLYGASTKNADGSSQTTSNYGKGGTITTEYDKEGVRTKMTIETKDGTKQTSLYEGGNIKERTTTKDGETTKTVYSDGKEKTTKYDKNGKEIKYDTGEGGNVLVAPTAEEFLRIKNFGGGYTDGRPELQSNVQMEKNPGLGENRYSKVINVNPDYIEATSDKPNLGNIVQPETRPELQGPKPVIPPSPGNDQNSNDPNKN